MTPKESPGHIYESVCLNQITPPGKRRTPSRASVPSDRVQALMCWVEIPRTDSHCVSPRAALRWSHPRGVRMKTGAVPSSPRWVRDSFRNGSVSWNRSCALSLCVNESRGSRGPSSNRLLNICLSFCLPHGDVWLNSVSDYSGVVAAVRVGVDVWSPPLVPYGCLLQLWPSCVFNCVSSAVQTLFSGCVAVVTDSRAQN